MPTFIVIFIDIALLNVLFFISYSLNMIPGAAHEWFLWNFSYVFAILAFRPLAQNRMSKVEKVASRSFNTALTMSVVFGLFLWVEDHSLVHFALAVLSTVAIFLVIFSGRFLSRKILKWQRNLGKNNLSVVFVGAGHNLDYLFDCMTKTYGTGYRVAGYFDDKDSELIGDKLNRLGSVADVISWLENNKRPQILFCNLPSARSQEIIELINYCDNHFIRFCSVPNVRNYVHRAMEVQMLGDMPVLTVRRDPLQNQYNQFLKRTFDLLISGTFIITCFWWIYLIVALISKITMPGPVFFKQKRNGLHGKEFYCLKFRSMKVNADADKLQATKDDPRKTKWGNIMRKTSIDELPQFLNVFMGDMSIVGPRPHMVSHTELYSDLIEKYMVRHWVKPGITGWAQVRGARGETEHLWQMEDRIKKDIYYIENWSLWLDIKIMFFTVYNALGGDKQAY